MGKCKVCVEMGLQNPREASMMGRSDARGQMMRIRCAEHKQPGDVPRSSWGSRGTAEDGGGKRPKLGKPKGVPINLEMLPDTPTIVVSMGPDWLAAQMGELSFKDVVTGSSTRWAADTQKELDLTSNKPEWRDIAQGVYSKLFREDQLPAMLLCVKEVADIFNSNRYNHCACFGAVAVNYHTPKHQHAPFGVIHMCGAGSKEWKLWAPDTPVAACLDDEATKIKQGAGDLLWIPPGWHHDVHTTGGLMLTTTLNVAPHWVGWCMPKRLVHQSLAAMGCGVTKEQQCPSNLHQDRKKKIYYACQKHYQTPAAPPKPDAPAQTTASAPQTEAMMVLAMAAAPESDAPDEELTSQHAILDSMTA